MKTSLRPRPVAVARWVGAVALGVGLLQAAGAQTFTTTTSTTSGTSSGCPAHVEVTITTETTFGPATILIGENRSQVYFVAAGATNVNTNTHTQSFVCAAPVPMLAGWSVGLLAMLLLLLHPRNGRAVAALKSLARRRARH